MIPAAPTGPSMPTASPLAPELVGFASCPSCHTTDSAATNAAVAAGGDWRCRRCGQRWDADRLAAVAGYAAWVSEREAS